MARQTWAQLAELYPDNTIGAISAQDLRDGLVDSMRPHTAGSDPTTDNDATEGFDVGHEWLNTTTGDWFKCRNASVGAAVWEPAGGEGTPVWRGAWSAGSYEAGEAVSHAGSSFVANTTTSEEPPHADWDVLAAKGDPGSGGSSAWGDLTGTLSDQTDLQNALNAKADASSLATVATSGDYTDLSNRPTLGSAAAANTGDFATAAQGGKADTALQPGDELTDLASTGATAGHVPKSDGNGGINWAAESGGDTSALLPKLATVNSYAGNRTLDADDSGAYVRITASGTVTLPDGLDTGFQCVIVNATTSDTVELAAATTLTLPSGFEPEIQNRRAVTVIHVGSNVWEAHGALVEES